MDTLKLSMVSARGISGTIGTEKVMMRVVFGCPFTKAAAKVLGIDWLYAQEQNGALRGFTEHKTGISYKDADLAFKRAEGQQQYDLGLSCPVDDIEVVREDNGNTLKFRVSVPIDSPEMTAYLVEARKEPCWQVVIQGKQKEFDFEPKEKKPRGRPKKDKGNKEE